MIVIQPATPNKQYGNQALMLENDSVDASSDDASVCFSGLFNVNTCRTVELLRPFAF